MEERFFELPGVETSCAHAERLKKKPAACRKRELRELFRNTKLLRNSVRGIFGRFRYWKIVEKELGQAVRDQMVYNQKARLLDPGRTARMAALSRLLFLAFSFSRSLFRILFLDFSFSASLFCPLFLTFSFSPSRSRILFFAFSSSASLSRLLFLAFWHVPTLGKSGSRRRSCKLWCGRVDRNVRRCSAGASSSGDFFVL